MEDCCGPARKRTRKKLAHVSFRVQARHMVNRRGGRAAKDCDHLPATKQSLPTCIWKPFVPCVALHTVAGRVSRSAPCTKPEIRQTNLQQHFLNREGTGTRHSSPLQEGGRSCVAPGKGGKPVTSKRLSNGLSLEACTCGRSEEDREDPQRDQQASGLQVVEAQPRRMVI